jgi:hypothetical protein
MGGGVGIGDFNNDRLRDVFFSGNQVSSKLYVNQGNLTFKEITKEAGLSTSRWAIGVNIIDINNDAFDDIYVCLYQGDNLLFINQEDLTFTDKVKPMGWRMKVMPSKQCSWTIIRIRKRMFYRAVYPGGFQSQCVAANR